MTTTTVAPDTLIQVEDLDGRWHAAAIGPGVLCIAAPADVTFQTVQWAYGTELVDCPTCLRRMAGLRLAAA